jgi:hypothetical protein
MFWGAGAVRTALRAAGPVRRLASSGTRRPPRVLKTDAELEVPFVVRELEKRYGAVVTHLPEHVTEDQLCTVARDSDLILTCYGNITKRVIDSAPHLKGIVKYGVGIDAINIDAAKARGVPVGPCILGRGACMHLPAG